MKLLLTDKAKRFPPIKCRLLARFHYGGNRVTAMSDADIARQAQLPIAQVKHISWSLSWDEIPFGQMMRFLQGCNIDFDNRNAMKVNTFMINKGTFKYLRKSPLWKDQFIEMVRYMRTSYGK